MLNWHTLHWWFLAVVFGCYVVYQISIDPITWDSVIAVILFLLAVSIPSIKWLITRHRKRTFFEPEYQHTQNTHDSTYTTTASDNEQNVQTSVVMAVECHVEFIGIVFEGKGTLPKITGLYDWQWKGEEVPPWIKAYSLDEEKDPEGRWFWYYLTPFHRLKDSRITIGISYLATDYFEGHILYGLNCKEGKKRQYLPFNVKKRSS